MDGLADIGSRIVDTALLLTIFGYLIHFKGKITNLCYRLKRLEDITNVKRRIKRCFRNSSKAKRNTASSS